MEPEFSSVFELEPTLKRINGNTVLLKKLMGFFGGLYRNTGGEIADLVQRENYAEAEMLAHRLVAASAQLGALKLSKAASEVEQALKNQALQDIGPSLGELKRLLVQATALAATYSASPEL